MYNIVLCLYKKGYVLRYAILLNSHLNVQSVPSEFTLVFIGQLKSVHNCVTSASLLPSASMFEGDRWTLLPFPLCFLHLCAIQNKWKLFCHLLIFCIELVVLHSKLLLLSFNDRTRVPRITAERFTPLAKSRSENTFNLICAPTCPSVTVYLMIWSKF